MRLVIADTGPVNYLILIGNIELLPRICERVVLPNAGAPQPVQRWIATLPIWLEIAETPRQTQRPERDMTTARVSLKPGVALPPRIAIPGNAASIRFLEFFTVNIRNPNTRGA